MNIAFYESSEWEEKYTQEMVGKELQDSQVHFVREPVTGSTQVPKDCEVVCVFIASEIGKQFFEKNPHVKLVATRSTGFDHIDLKVAKEKGVMVCNVPNYGENTVAEFAIALMLMVCRRMYQSVKRVKEHGLFSYEGLRGYDLKGKTLGVVGTGRIGAHVIKIAKGFEMEILAHDPYPNDALAREFAFSYVSLPELLGKSDIISLHVPYLPTTHHLLNKETFKQVKTGAVLINTARGALVETEALVEALKNGVLSGAGLDVLEEEGFIKDEMEMLYSGHPSTEQLKTVLADHELMYMDNVIITPHNAFQTREAMARILGITLDNIKAFIVASPINLV